MTNGDRIRQMTDDEIAEFLNDVTDCCSDGYICEKCPLNSVGKHCNIFTFEKWLKQECEENDET